MSTSAQSRARNALGGTDNMPWENRQRARALNVAATVLGTWVLGL